MSSASISLSIIVPAYNYATTLRRALVSVIPQLTDSHELIVIDDGSIDDTPAVVAELAREFPGRFRYVRKDNGGLSSARNRGIQESSGDFLIFLDADDELLPEALARLESHISSHPDTRMVVGGHISVWPDGRTREHRPKQIPADPVRCLRDYLLDKNLVISNGACAMHRNVFSRGSYPESFRSAEDIPVFAQTLAYYPCSILPAPLAYIHKHDDSLRHQIVHAKAGGTRLVDEVFSEQRLGPEFQFLKQKYSAQRNLSLFRSAYLSNDVDAAKDYLRNAVKQDWKVLFKSSYMKKAIRLWLR